MMRRHSPWAALVLGMCLLQPLPGQAGSLVWKNGTNEVQPQPDGQGWAVWLQPLWAVLGRP